MVMILAKKKKSCSILVKKLEKQSEDALEWIKHEGLEREDVGENHKKIMRTIKEIKRTCR